MRNILPGPMPSGPENLRQARANLGQRDDHRTGVRYGRRMEPVGKWWNGTWGRLARRDVFLRVGTLWEVEAREGGADGRSRIWRFLSEEEARAFAERCMTRPGKW